MANPPDNDVLLLILLATLAREDFDDDPRLRELLYRAFRRQRQFRESWGPELEELFEFGLRFRRRPSRLEEAREVATAVLDGFRAGFEESVGKRLEELSSRIGVVEKTQIESATISAHQADDELTTKHTLHEFIWMLSARVDIENVRMVRYVPVRMFLGDPVPEEETRERLVKALTDLLEPLGFERSYELPEQSGSWWKRLVLRTKGFFTQDEVKKRLETAERAVEVQYLDKPQAEANSLQATAAAGLIGALKEVPNACIQVGTLLVVKATDAGGQCAVVARTLTQDELRRLEEEQSILRRPEAVLEFLQAPRGRLTSG